MKEGERWGRIKLDCSKCPMAKKDCDWIKGEFIAPPSTPKLQWCPLLITIGNVMELVRPREKGGE